jgi:Tannase and feruloyl esterase
MCSKTQGRRLLALTAALMGSAVLPPVTASAAPTLPTCSQLATLLAGNTFITQTASDNQGKASPTAVITPATATNAAYCNVQFQFSSQSGPTYGYAVGESQTIDIGIGLPLNATDGGTPSNPKGATWTAVNGAWNGKIENIGGGGDVGTVGSTTAATNGGYVGSSTDAGHNVAQTGTVGNFGVIQATHQLDVGKLNDFTNGAIHQQYTWAKFLAQNYYGQPALRNYWSGCSTGGREGLGLAEEFGSDFDGIYAGAPANGYQEFWLGEAWPGLVNRDDVVGAGHPAITNTQFNTAVAHAIAACDVEGTDVVADGVIDDPRQCTYQAETDSTILAAPAGTCTGANCLDLVQAAAIDKIWDGPRNNFGQRIWHPWYKDTAMGSGEALVAPNVPVGTINAGQAMVWDHRDTTFASANMYSTRALAAANPLGEPSPIAIEDEFVLADSAGGPEDIVRSAGQTAYQDLLDNFYTNCKNGPGNCKLITWQGGADQFIFPADSIETYREVATLYGHGKTDFGQPTSNGKGTGMQTWWRYYHAPGVMHCGNGVGASPVSPTLQDGQTQIFDDLVKWVETGVPPQSAGDSTKLGVLGTSSNAAVGTRPVCPWPTTAIYTGTGSTTVASNYTCSGNLDAYPPTADTNNVATLCQGIHTVYGQEDKNKLDYDEQGVNPGECEGNNNTPNMASNR